jgi:replicative DNA helicase
MSNNRQWVEYERSLVGALLNSPDKYYETKVADRHFGDSLSRLTFQTIEECLEDGVEPSLITVTAKSETLAKRVSEVSALTTSAPFGKLDFYEKEIIKAYRTRELTLLAQELLEIADDPDAAIGVLDERLAEITAIEESDRIHTARELVKDAIDEVERRYHADGQLPGIRSGFTNLDAYTGGWQPRMLYYIGSRPSEGKSAILLNAALNAAMKSLPIGIVSAESSKRELILRGLSNVASVDGNSLKSGRLSDADFAGLTKAASRLYDAPIFVYDVPNVNIMRLISVAKAMKRRHGIRALFVDYVQILESTRKDEQKRIQVGQVSLALKNLSRELDIPVIVAAQLRRDSTGRRPTLADFAESSQIEMDADAAILLQHEKDESGETVRVWAHVDKNRDGPTGSVKLKFVGRFVRFTEEARDGEGGAA